MYDVLQNTRGNGCQDFCRLLPQHLGRVSSLAGAATALTGGVAPRAVSPTPARKTETQTASPRKVDVDVRYTWTTSLGKRYAAPSGRTESSWVFRTRASTRPPVVPVLAANAASIYQQLLIPYLVGTLLLPCTWYRVLLHLERARSAVHRARQHANTPSEDFPSRLSRQRGECKRRAIMGPCKGPSDLTQPVSFSSPLDSTPPDP